MEVVQKTSTLNEGNCKDEGVCRKRKLDDSGGDQPEQKREHAVVKDSVDESEGQPSANGPPNGNPPANQHKLPKNKTQQKKKQTFQYGNYHQYYGYRNPNKQDERLTHMKKDWFTGKDILDIGCNAGHVTLQIARDFGPKKIIGVDIDPHLISVARNSIKNFRKTQESSEYYPGNVKFVAGNYVLEDDLLFENIKPEYDVILCLSVTKWIHLNWGDAGLKRVFKRIFAQLRPAGKFILEAQDWLSYGKRKKLTEVTKQNYASIQFYPEKFADYLLSEVGFASCEVLAVPNHSCKGFQRPIQVFTKSCTIQEI